MSYSVRATPYVIGREKVLKKKENLAITKQLLAEHVETHKGENDNG